MATQAEKSAAKTDGAKEFFDEFIEDNTKVTSEDPSAISSYFVRINDLTKSGAFGITKENDPELYHQLKRFPLFSRCFFILYPMTSSTPIWMEHQKSDMAEVRVTIKWDEDDRETLRRTMDRIFSKTIRRRNNVGHTVIEVLMALALTALVFTLIWSFWSSSRKSEEQLATGFSAQQDLVIAMQRIVFELQEGTELCFPKADGSRQIRSGFHQSCRPTNRILCRTWQ